MPCVFCATDLECIFTVISNLVSKVQTPDEALAMADQIGNKLFLQPIDKPILRLKMYWPETLPSILFPPDGL